MEEQKRNMDDQAKKDQVMNEVFEGKRDKNQWREGRMKTATKRLWQMEVESKERKTKLRERLKWEFKKTEECVKSEKK